MWTCGHTCCHRLLRLLRYSERQAVIRTRYVFCVLVGIGGSFSASPARHTRTHTHSRETLHAPRSWVAVGSEWGAFEHGLLGVLGICFICCFRPTEQRAVRVGKALNRHTSKYILRIYLSICSCLPGIAGFYNPQRARLEWMRFSSVSPPCIVWGVCKSRARRRRGYQRWESHVFVR